MIKKIYYKIRKPLRNAVYNNSKRKIDFPNFDLSLNEVQIKLNDQNLIYKYFHQYYWHKAPIWLKEHRTYFSMNNRGFGEDAFHAMWYLLFLEFKPKKVLEIGVFRGQIVSLWTKISQEMNLNTGIHAISPFEAISDGTTEFPKGIDYSKDLINSFNHFGLHLCFMHKGLSTESKMVEIIRSNSWDIVYIDGNHLYEYVKQDFLNSYQSLANNGIIVIDDSSLNTNFSPPIYASKGHPGPSRVANELAIITMKEILSVGHNRCFQKR